MPFIRSARATTEPATVSVPGEARTTVENIEEVAVLVVVAKVIALAATVATTIIREEANAAPTTIAEVEATIKAVVAIEITTTEIITMIGSNLKNTMVKVNLTTKKVMM